MTKDPFLYAGTGRDAGHGLLSHQGRMVNKMAGRYPLKVLSRFSKRLNRPLSELNILLVGMAFKGWPETNDLRGSIAVDIGQELLSKVVVMAYGVVDISEIQSLGIKSSPLLEGAAWCDALDFQQPS